MVYKTMMRQNLTSQLGSEDDERPYTTEKAAQSYALRLLIHYLGDIHQPLHCSTRVDSAFPQGDKGGNEFAIPNHYESEDLHAVWDSVLYTYHGSSSLVTTSTLNLNSPSPQTPGPS